VVSIPAAVAVGVSSDGRRRVLEVDAGRLKDEASWTSFLRQLVGQGLEGVGLVVSDAHVGLERAIVKVLPGAAWQRCRVHFMRNLLATVPKGAQEAASAAVRTIFDLRPARPRERPGPAPPGGGGAPPPVPRAAELLEEAAEDALAYLHFPEEHRRRPRSAGTPESGSRGSSSAGPRWSGSSPTGPPCRAWWGWSSPSGTRGGPWRTAGTRAEGSMRELAAPGGGEDRHGPMAMIA
jgi:hypothetical protein